MTKMFLIKKKDKRRVYVLFYLSSILVLVALNEIDKKICYKVLQSQFEKSYVWIAGLYFFGISISKNVCTKSEKNWEVIDYPLYLLI